MGIFKKATNDEKTNSNEIEIFGNRKLFIKKYYKNIVMFDFEELFFENLGVADYQAICKNFDIIFLQNLIKLKPEDRNEAKRLILFIDEVYESKKDLLILAEDKIEEIYKSGTGSEAFKRTISRIKEITQKNWIIILFWL